MPSPKNPNWLFDYPTIDDAFLWDPHELSGPSRASIEAGGSFIEPGASNSGSRKRVRPEESRAPGSKACREKMRRDKLNDKFLELAAVMDPEKPPKMDKAAILSDAARMVTHLKNEAQKLKDSNSGLKQKIDELKNEKNELRDEKQSLKEEKSSLEQQIKAMSMQPSFLPYPPMMPCFAPVHADGGKLMMPPYVGHTGFMFQFQAPANAGDKNELPPAA